jgi:ubiquitin C-terminal hydrolase
MREKVIFEDVMETMKMMKWRESSYRLLKSIGQRKNGLTFYAVRNIVSHHAADEVERKLNLFFNVTQFSKNNWESILQRAEKLIEKLAECDKRIAEFVNNEPHLLSSKVIRLLKRQWRKVDEHLNAGTAKPRTTMHFHKLRAVVVRFIEVKLQKKEESVDSLLNMVEGFRKTPLEKESLAKYDFVHVVSSEMIMGSEADIVIGKMHESSYQISCHCVISEDGIDKMFHQPLFISRAKVASVVLCVTENMSEHFERATEHYLHNILHLEKYHIDNAVNDSSNDAQVSIHALSGQCNADINKPAELFIKELQLLTNTCCLGFSANRLLSALQRKTKTEWCALELDVECGLQQTDADNCNMMCVNSLVQCLNKLPWNLGDEQAVDDTLAHAYVQLLTRMTTGNCVSVHRKFVDTIQDFYSSRSETAVDAYDLLKWLINQLHSDLNQWTEVSMATDDEVIFSRVDYEWRNYLKKTKAKSIIVDTFYGLLSSVNDTIFKAFSILDVSVPESKEKLDLEEIMAKDKLVWLSPKILIVRLIKINRQQVPLVDFPIRDLDVEKYCAEKYKCGQRSNLKFDLIAVLNRHHNDKYTAYCQSKSTHNWKWYDNGIITHIENEEDVITSDAYILFYQRHGAFKENLHVYPSTSDAASCSFGQPLTSADAIVQSGLLKKNHSTVEHCSSSSQNMSREMGVTKNDELPDVIRCGDEDLLDETLIIAGGEEIPSS